MYITIFCSFLAKLQLQALLNCQRPRFGSMMNELQDDDYSWTLSRNSMVAIFYERLLLYVCIFMFVIVINEKDCD